MTLIVGGKGFIGAHAARALLDMGEPCVITTGHPERPMPKFLDGEIDRLLFVERVELDDGVALLEIGRRRRIDRIVDLAAAPGRPFGTVESLRSGMAVLLNVLEAARTWEVERLCVASTIGVYGGVEGGLREDALFPTIPLHPIPAFKRSVEILVSSFAMGTGLEAVTMRFAAWGPLFHHPPSPMNVPVQMLKAALRGEALDYRTPPSRAFAEDGADIAYVKDCGRAIALLALADKLRHSIYNIGTGEAMKNGALAAAIRRHIPSARLDLPEGFDPEGPQRVFELDTTRLREDTGFETRYDLDAAVADYAGWLRAGNPY